ncbi:FMN-binding protein [Nakamurella flava]|uniref:FMN-binding protein n=1 Tax=Nakamurella flava TaxID=2576308 RepID=A0A4U6QKC5_9ACTN|nr:FMN-binding protein [Nakamurella flava]TKV60771.1 FMN-binding protein [Nakamurella flava]
MRRILLWAMSTLSAVVLLFSYKTSTNSSAATVLPESSAVAPIVGGTAPTTGGAPSTGSSGSTSSGTTSSGGSSAGTSSNSGTSATAAPTTADPSTTSGSTTVTGSVAQTRWGPVQVQLTVESGRITQVSVLQYPDGNGKDQQINARALPVLISETVSAQSADIDMVSGATVTSQGYRTSLQSALDQAGL